MNCQYNKLKADGDAKRMPGIDLYKPFVAIQYHW